MAHKFAFALSCIATAALLTACGGSDDNSTGWSSNGTTPVSLQFAAYAGTSPIQCGTAITGLGSSSKSANILDLRFYISDVQFIKEDGTKVALKPSTDNNNYTGTLSGETHSVSLLTLSQTGVGACTAGAALNKAIEGTLAAGHYVGVTMTLGVPFSLNHLNATDAATPAVLRSDINPGMSWNWRGGRKFTKIELQSTETGNPVTLQHLGSTGCVGDPAAGTPISTCTAPNRVTLSFASFDPAKQAIALDVKSLFAANDFSVANMCMSSPTAAICTGQFEALALNFNATDGSGTGLPITGKTQTVFKTVSR